MPAQRLDRRSRRSRAALESALLDLIGERDLTHISVSDVTGRADVHRSTFYEHYTDVHDLAASACTQMFDQLIAATSSLPADDASPEGAAHRALSEVFAHVAEHGPLYRALLSSDGSARVINHLLERMTAGVHDGISERDAPHVADSTAAFISGALLGTILDWLNRGCPGTPEELSAAISPHLVAAGTAQPPDAPRG